MTPAERVAAHKAAKGHMPTNGGAGKAETHVFTNDLARRRKMLGLSQDDVAAATGMSMPTVGSIERGCNTNLVYAMKLSDFYGASVQDIWRPLQAANGK